MPDSNQLTPSDYYQLLHLLAVLASEMRTDGSSTKAQLDRVNSAARVIEQRRDDLMHSRLFQ